MAAAGNPGLERFGSDLGWHVGTLTPEAVAVWDRDAFGGYVSPDPRPLVLLVDGRFATILPARPAAVQKGWRRRPSPPPDVTVHKGNRLTMPERAAINPWHQLLETLPRIASNHGVNLEP
jgi:hypothetical protein